jgi:hypothetical protein
MTDASPRPLRASRPEPLFTSGSPEPHRAWPDAETEALLRAIGRQSPLSPAEGGLAGEALRAQAFRVMVLRPLTRLLSRALRRLGEHSGIVPTYRAETARRTCTPRE